MQQLFLKPVKTAMDLAENDLPNHTWYKHENYGLKSWSTNTKSIFPRGHNESNSMCVFLKKASKPFHTYGLILYPCNEDGLGPWVM